MTTIQQIDGENWADAKAGSTFLVRRCTALRRKPLAEFTVEDLRIMLGQKLAVPVLLPLALDALVENPLAAGDFYPGDLLFAVLRLPSSVWDTMPGERDRLFAIVSALDLEAADLPPDAGAAVDAVRQRSA